MLGLFFHLFIYLFVCLFPFLPFDRIRHVVSFVFVSCLTIQIGALLAVGKRSSLFLIFAFILSR